MSNAFKWLEYDLVERIGMTLSFGTIERALGPADLRARLKVLVVRRRATAAPSRVRA